MNDFLIQASNPPSRCGHYAAARALDYDFLIQAAYPLSL
jgi:hypothetical protein